MPSHTSSTTSGITSTGGPGDTKPPAGLSGASQSVMVPSTLYCRQRLVSAGVFTTGSGLDWSTQFDDSAVATSFFPVIGGEITAPSVSIGVCVDIAFYTSNPYDFSVWIEASAGAGTVQLYVNGAVTELTAAALVTISAIRGYNVIKISRATGPVMLFGRYLSQLGISRWQSLYKVGSDPVVSTSGPGANNASPLSNSPTTP